MSECEGCNFWFEDNDRQQPCCGARGGKYLEDIKEPCHLTPDHQRFIDAMIRGVFNCDHCKWLGTCDSKPTDPEEFCAAWQERKEGEDG